jgi:CDP-diacylglycerol---glycerol-3-phosphate 3-phosphatidyltransferase
LTTHKSLNTPNLLTIIRLICSPVFLPILIVYLLPYNIFWVNCIVVLLFGFLSVTDFFDGYLARRLQQETVLGRVLDPIADKFLLYATLIALLAAGKIYFYWVIILIGREFFVMGLRQIALENNFTIKVSALGKLKTTLQMITLTVLILNPYHTTVSWQGLCNNILWNGGELLLLILTTAVALLSAQRYYRAFMKTLQDKKPTTLS